MMDTRDYQVSFTFGPCDYQQEVSLRVHLLDFISKAVGVFFFCFLFFDTICVRPVPYATFSITISYE